MNKKQIAPNLMLIVGGLLFGFGLGECGKTNAQTNNTAQYATDAQQAYGFPPTSDPNGGWTPRRNIAAYVWHPVTLVPTRPDGVIDPVTGKRVPKWPILADYPFATSTPGGPDVVYYWDGTWRNPNGSRAVTPRRWAYARMEPEVWNPDTQRMEVPGLPGSPPAPDPTNPDDKPGVHMDDTQGQWMVDDLKRSFTTNRINGFLEASPYDEPDTGAPEPLWRESQQLQGTVGRGMP